MMEAKALAVVTPRAYRSGESAKLKISTRNIETLTFAAYKLDPEAYFRKNTPWARSSRSTWASWRPMPSGRPT